MPGETHYELAYALFTEQMECQYLNRDFDEAERLFEMIIANSANQSATRPRPTTS